MKSGSAALSVGRLLAIVLLASSASAETNFFPIMPWNHAPNDLTALKRIKDCGFTVAGFVSPATLDNCEKAGLKAIVSDARTSGYDWGKVDAAAARKNVY